MEAELSPGLTVPWCERVLSSLNHHLADAQHCSQTGASICTPVHLTRAVTLLIPPADIAAGMKLLVGRLPVLLQGHGHSLCGLPGYSSSLCWLGTNTSRWRARKQCSCGEADADAAEHLHLPVKPLILAIACHGLPG